MGAAAMPIMVGMQVAGAALNAVGTYQGMQAQAANAAYQAQVARNNSDIAKQNYDLESDSGQIQAENFGMRTRSVIGAAKAQQGASGVDVNSGSAVDVRAGAAEIGELDALSIRSNAARRAYGYEVAATSDTAQAGLLQDQSENLKSAAPMAAFSSLLSAAGGAGASYTKYYNVGGLSGGGTGAPGGDSALNADSTATLSLMPTDI